MSPTSDPFVAIFRPFSFYIRLTLLDGWLVGMYCCPRLCTLRLLKLTMSVSVKTSCMATLLAGSFSQAGINVCLEGALCITNAEPPCGLPSTVSLRIEGCFKKSSELEWQDGSHSDHSFQCEVAKGDLDPICQYMFRAIQYRPESRRSSL